MYKKKAVKLTVVNDNVHSTEGIDARLYDLLAVLDAVVVRDGLAALRLDFIDKLQCWRAI